MSENHMVECDTCMNDIYVKTLKSGAKEVCPHCGATSELSIQYKLNGVE